jgi:hypothetical protein
MIKKKSFYTFVAGMQQTILAKVVVQAMQKLSMAVISSL